MINPLISLKIKQKAKKPIFSFNMQVLDRNGKCYACGAKDQFWQFSEIIDNELATTWGLSKSLRNSFDARESMFCPQCGCSFRLRLLSEALVDTYGGSSLTDLVTSNLKDLKVAEINSCGKLHQFLENLPYLNYSEYGSSDANIPSENLEALSYKKDSFDLVMTSDTLEHVPDFNRAMTEIYRILKPNGLHIFTIPVVWLRKTRRRAELQDEGVKNLLAPSYHGVGQPDYLVFTEFGYDIIERINELGFDVKVYKLNLLNLSDTSGVFIVKKKLNEGTI